MDHRCFHFEAAPGTISERVTPQWTTLVDFLYDATHGKDVACLALHLCINFSRLFSRQPFLHQNDLDSSSPRRCCGALRSDPPVAVFN